MSDYFAGQMDGMQKANFFGDIAADNLRRQADREISSLEDNISEWKQYANGLKGRLDKTEGDAVATAGALRGERAASEQLSYALSLLAPDHPLLHDGSLLKGVRIQAAEKYANEQGYYYNRETGGVRAAS